MRKWLFIMVLLIAAIGVFAVFPICLGHFKSQLIIKAVEQQNITLVKSLLEQGANPNTKHSFGTPLLIFSVLQNNRELAELLLDEGADVNIRHNALFVKFPWEDRISSSDAVGGWSPLHVAVMEGNLEIIELLLAKGADVDARDLNARSPLHYAIIYGKEADIVKVLLEKGADVNAKDNRFGMTPLHDAAVDRLNFKPDVVKLLIDYGANVDSGKNEAWTPLHWASINRNLKMVEMLIANGADVNARNKNGSTALHLTFREDNTDLARILLDAGADVNIKNNEGWTPLDKVIEKGHTNIAELLKTRGAKTSAELNISD